VSGRIQAVVPRTLTACMEQLQDGYVAAIGAAAGATVEWTSRDLYGTDARLVRQADPSVEETCVLLQLKSTTVVKPDPSAPDFPFKFKKRRHFEWLAMERTTNKALLVVMTVHPSQANWITATHDYLRLHHCCYWVNLEGQTVREAVQQPTVRVPTVNIFDANALTGILDRIDRGEAP
jgi:hypothetical protein